MAGLRLGSQRSDGTGDGKEHPGDHGTGDDGSAVTVVADGGSVARKFAAARWKRGVVAGAAILVIVTVGAVLLGLPFASERDAAASSGDATTTPRISLTTAVVAPASAVTSVPPSSSTVDRSVPVSVLNATAVAGSSSRVAQQLRADGWTDVDAGNSLRADLTRNTIYYGAGSARERAAAEHLAGMFDAVTLPRPADMSGNVVFVICEP